MQRGILSSHPPEDNYKPQKLTDIRVGYPDALAVRTKNKQAKRTRREKRGTLHPVFVCFRECVRRFNERLTQRENQLRFSLLNLFGEIFLFFERGEAPFKTVRNPLKKIWKFDLSTYPLW